MSMLLPLVFPQVLACAGLLAAPEDLAASETLKPLYVQIEVALEEVRVVPCRIEASESGGGIYDRAALDLDGDGDFETTVAGEKGILGTTDGRSSFCLPLVFDDAKFNVQLRGKLADPTQGKIYLYWTLDRGGTHLFFINGQAEAHGTAAAAAAGAALRLGPPFHFKTGSTTRGPDALVNVGLKDANGCTLRSARVAGGDSIRGTESQIQLTFVREGEPGTTIAAQYGWSGTCDVPVAEPSGEYQVDLSVDLSPAYGKIEDRQTITISQPPEDILDRRLAECASDDAATRLAAVADLAYFKEDGNRVFPALVRCLDDADKSVRSRTVYSMGRFPEQVAKHPEVMIRILGDEQMDASRRGYAAYLLGEHGPLTEQVSIALAVAADTLGTGENDRFARALARFETRRSEATPGAR